MNFQLSEEQTLLRDSVRAFAKAELLPVAGELDKKGEFPEAQFKGMAELGLMGVAVPEEWGGAGMDNVSYALAIEELSAGCASCGVITSVNNSLVNDPLLRFGNDAQKEEWLKPIAQGSKIGCFALSEPDRLRCRCTEHCGRKEGQRVGNSRGEELDHQRRSGRSVYRVRHGR